MLSSEETVKSVQQPVKLDLQYTVEFLSRIKKPYGALEENVQSALKTVLLLFFSIPRAASHPKLSIASLILIKMLKQ